MPPMTFSQLANAELDGSLCFSLVREMIDVEIVARFTVEGEPVSKQRPRFSKKNGRVYTPGGTQSAEKQVAWSFRQAVQGVALDPDDSFGFFVGFFCGTGQRRDVDNMTKLVLDGLNGVAWVDDAQVTEVSAKVKRWQQPARTEVVVYRTPRQGRPQTTCEVCSKTFPIYPSAPERRHCSKRCQLRTSQIEKECKRCGAPFTVQASQRHLGQVHCSMTCKRAQQAEGLVRLSCQHCRAGFTLRPSEYKRRPNARFCSATCRNKSRAKGAPIQPAHPDATEETAQ